MIITIKVTQEHINKGIKNICNKCPVALALNEYFNISSASVSHNYLSVVMKNWIARRWSTPETVSKFIKNFDTDNVVTPFEFNINE